MRRGGQSSAYDRPGGKARSEDGMNGMERAYAHDVLEPRRMAGEIIRYRFEPFAIKLAPKTFYRPDFLVELAGEWVWPSAMGKTESGLQTPRMITPWLEIHEVKGRWEDAGRIKLKVAASQQPWFRFIAVRSAGRGRYEYEEIPPA